MGLYFPVVAFSLFYFFCFVFIEGGKAKLHKSLLVFALTVLTFLIGFRNGWPDQLVYEIAFLRVPDVFNFDFYEQPFGYVEKGYSFLASIVKTIYDNSTFYFLTMGGLSMWLLYKSLTKYCYIPLIGLCDYIARFLLNRDFIQMRSSLAILLIIFATKYVYERKIWHYFGIILLAYQFHHLSLLAIPFYFMSYIKFKKWHILAGLLFAAIASQTIANYITGWVENYSDDLQYTTYTQGSYVSRALGLSNPMILFQSILLLLFTYSEKDLKPFDKYYYIYRTGYFYSTLILIFFCNYTALSGRTSTVFATLEMFMIPLMSRMFARKNRLLYYTGIGLFFIYFFFSKYSQEMAHMKDNLFLNTLD